MLKQKALETKRRTSMLLAIVLGLATIVGGLAAALAFLPRVSVVPSDPVDINNPFSASFTITNMNYIPLREVSVSFNLGQIATAPAQYSNNLVSTFNTGFKSPKWKRHTLTMDEKYTITPGDIFTLPPSVQISGADIAIAISFRPWILPFTRKKVFRFIAKKQTNGYFYWYSYPLN
jgi:hypothetical protein